MTALPNDPTPLSLEAFTKLVKEFQRATRYDAHALSAASERERETACAAVLAAYSALLTRQPSADSARLDWLEAEAGQGFALGLPQKPGEPWWLFGLVDDFSGDTLRAAIDSARHREGT